VLIQVYLDIVEQVNVLMNSKGVVLRCDVTGKMTMKAFLSGMPEVKVGLNDKLEVRITTTRVWRFEGRGEDHIMVVILFCSFTLQDPDCQYPQQLLIENVMH